MMKLLMTDSQDNTPQIQMFQENTKKSLQWLLSIIRRLGYVMLASALPDLFQPTAHQYLE